MRVIHDHEFATPARSFAEFRLRLKYISEKAVGKALRQEQSAEEEAFMAALSQAKS